MGCFGSSEDEGNGHIAFISFRDYEQTLLQTQDPLDEFRPLDCSVDSLDGKFKAETEFHNQKLNTAQFFKMSQFLKVNTDGSVTLNVPTDTDLQKALKEIGIGKEMKVLCYDSEDGQFASYAAFLLAGFGFNRVHVLSDRFAEFVEFNKVTSAPKVKKAGGKTFELLQRKAWFAQPLAVHDIVNGLSSAQLIDCRPKKVWQEQAIAKSKNVPYTSCFSKHIQKSSKDITKAFEDAKIDPTKPIVYFGGIHALMVRAAADHIGFTPAPVYLGTYDEWHKDYIRLTMLELKQNPSLLATLDDERTADLLGSTLNVETKMSAGASQLLLAGTIDVMKRMNKNIGEVEAEKHKDGTVDFHMLKDDYTRHIDSLDEYQSAKDPKKHLDSDGQDLLMNYIEKANRRRPEVVEHLLSRSITPNLYHARADGNTALALLASKPKDMEAYGS